MGATSGRFNCDFNNVSRYFFFALFLMIIFLLLFPKSLKYLIITHYFYLSILIPSFRVMNFDRLPVL